MNRCKTCKYFKHDEDFIEQKNWCSHEDISEGAHYDNIFEKDIYLSYSYDEGGVFHPSPNFGCVLHDEEKS